MNPLKLGTSKANRDMHYSVGAVIKKDDKYLLIDRMNFPLGFAGIAGHVDEGESEVEALIREVREESGLKVEGFSLVREEELDWNTCRRGIRTHHWYLFECQVSGEIVHNAQETKSIGWYSPIELRTMELEPVWDHWFKQLNILG